MSGNVPVGGYLPVSFVDWTGHVAPVLFLCGCNFRCPYCHNSDLVLKKEGDLCLEQILDDIRSRDPFLDGVVVSGGEPAIHEGLPAFLSKIKAVTGLRIKLDTNGSRPDVLGSLIERELVDAVSLDVKAPWRDYPGFVKGDGMKVMESLDLLKSSGIPFETRTTYVPDLMEKDDLMEIRSQIGAEPVWVIQPFRPGKTLDASLANGTAPDPGDLRILFPDSIVR